MDITAFGALQAPLSRFKVDGVQRSDQEAPSRPAAAASDTTTAPESRAAPPQSVVGSVVAADLAAQVPQDDVQPDIETLKRALISQIFKIDESTNIEEAFGGIEFSDADLQNAQSFLQNLDKTRPSNVVQPADAQRLNTSV